MDMDTLYSVHDTYKLKPNNLAIIRTHFPQPKQIHLGGAFQRTDDEVTHCVVDHEVGRKLGSERVMKRMKKNV